MRFEKDPWGLLGKTRKSKCCKGALDEIISYLHTGEIIWKCQRCGKETDWE